MARTIRFNGSTLEKLQRLVPAAAREGRRFGVEVTPHFDDNGGTILIMGSGDVSQTAENIIALLRQFGFTNVRG